MRELDKVLDGEKVLWEGSPQFWPFVLGKVILTSLFGLMWCGVMFFMFLINFFTQDGLMRFVVLLTPHFWIGFLLLFGPIIYQLLVFKHTHYAITDKRVIVQKGVIGRDFDIIDFDKITNAQVNVGFFDKLFGKNCGSVFISTPSTMSASLYTNRSNAMRPHHLSSITDPYNVFKMFKKVSHDVKTDIQYPNQYRPASNPGYNTSLK